MLQKCVLWPDVVEAGRALWIPGQSGLYSETLPQTKPNNNKRPQTIYALGLLAWGAGHGPSHALAMAGRSVSITDEDLLPSVMSKCFSGQKRWLLALVHGLNFLGPTPNLQLTSQPF